MEFKPINGYKFLHKIFIKDYIITNLVNSLFGVTLIYLAGFFYVKVKGVQVSSFPFYVILSPIVFLILAVLTIGQFEFREKLKASEKVSMKIDEAGIYYKDEKKNINLKWEMITGLAKSKFLSSITDYYVFYRGGKISFNDTFISEDDLKKFDVIINRERVFLKKGDKIFRMGDENPEIIHPADLIEKYSNMKFV